MPEMARDGRLEEVQEVQGRVPGLRVTAVTGHVLPAGAQQLRSAAFAGASLELFYVEPPMRVCGRPLSRRRQGVLGAVCPGPRHFGNPASTWVVPTHRSDRDGVASRLQITATAT